MGGLLHLVQQGGAWVGCSPAESPSRCIKYNSPPISSQCINFILFEVTLSLPLDSKWLTIRSVKNHKKSLSGNHDKPIPYWSVIDCHIYQSCFHLLHCFKHASFSNLSSTSFHVLFGQPLGLTYSNSYIFSTNHSQPF